MCAVDLTASGETIGAAGLQHLEGGPEVEVGYRFLKGHWGQGYATESALASIDFRLRRARASTGSSRSRWRRTSPRRRVLEKCGLTEIGLAHVYGLEHVKYEIRR